jgi:hypothetical protein
MSMRFTFLAQVRPRLRLPRLFHPPLPEPDCGRRVASHPHIGVSDARLVKRFQPPSCAHHREKSRGSCIQVNGIRREVRGEDHHVKT